MTICLIISSFGDVNNAFYQRKNNKSYKSKIRPQGNQCCRRPDAGAFSKESQNLHPFIQKNVHRQKPGQAKKSLISTSAYGECAYGEMCGTPQSCQARRSRTALRDPPSAQPPPSPSWSCRGGGGARPPNHNLLTFLGGVTFGNDENATKKAKTIWRFAPGHLVRLSCPLPDPALWAPAHCLELVLRAPFTPPW